MIVYICTNCEEPLLPKEFQDGKCPICGCDKIIPEDEYFALDTPQPQSQNIPKCPTCGSTNLSKITLAHKAGKIALFGVFGMGDNGKTWKCNNCGSKW